ncbi:MAG: flippase-like domain-containing protein [Clostridia bacterium]|nr:flippase-like domain-containing protein [Clostridia bacterium]
MKVNGKKLLSTCLVIASIVLVIVIAFSNSELENAWAALESLDPIWVLGILGCWFVYMFFDAFSGWVYLRREGFSISLGRTVNAALIGFYYSNITPSSAGGQPMQVNSLRKAGIPVGYGTMMATMRFLCNQFAVSVLSLLFWLMNREFVHQQLGDAIWLCRLGWIINFAGVPLGMLAAYHRSFIQKIAIGLIHLGARLHLVKNPDPAIATTTDVLDTYHTALMNLIKEPSRMLIQLLCSAVSIMGLIGSIYFVYHAFGFTGTPWYQLITISFMLYISACYTPLPGASGAQEGGFLLYYQGIIPGDRIGLALLVWRFFTYYMFLIVGVFTVILDRVLISRENRKKAAQSQ